MNAVEIEQAVSELAEASFDAAEFPYQFLEAFGDKETTLKRLDKLFEMDTQMTAKEPAATPAKKAGGRTKAADI